METYSIGDLSRATGVKATTIRFYEAEGLLPTASRTAGGHRVYDLAHLDRLGFIRHARQLGFGMEDIRELLRLADAAPEAPCEGADAIARRHLAAVRERLARLRSLEAELERMTYCHNGRVAECRVIEVLTDAAHGHCADPTHGGPDR
ncbi:MerR family transcriptional regulator [Roseicella aquatilis]|uniref:MerR family transcriptional regulator n=1 Tax=Roseicella aquatilis TaxID=2527868 RepID=A0A4R4DK89_9PROT|nr:helix-turn-helix domain-containing protein [Roseicella aquatilis]TCZ61019.1 MerR family transcriptional regulator [Roseicella aquatilis]